MWFGEKLKEYLGRKLGDNDMRCILKASLDGKDHVLTDNGSYVSKGRILPDGKIVVNDSDTLGYGPVSAELNMKKIYNAEGMLESKDVDIVYHFRDSVKTSTERIKYDPPGRFVGNAVK